MMILIHGGGHDYQTLMPRAMMDQRKTMMVIMKIDIIHDDEHNDLGYFMYVSARDGHDGDSATLESPKSEEKVTGCLIFSFNLYVSKIEQ